MSTQLAYQPTMELVNSLNDGATRVIANFERLGSNADRHSQSIEPAIATPAASMFVPLPAPTKSFVNKSSTFFIVVAAHVLAFVGLANFPQQARDSIVEPLQVVMLSEPQRAQDLPPLPVIMPRVETFDMPIEPVVIRVADQESTSITVRTQVDSTTAPTSTSATPKQVSSVEYIREPLAKYPPAARALKQRGIVTLRVLIDTTGHAREVNVYQSSGYRLLDDAARRAALEGLYKPFMEDGRAQAVYVLIPIEFSAA